MQVQIPAGVTEGGTFQVQTASGLVTVTVPKGAVSGQTMMIAAPAAVAQPVGAPVGTPQIMIQQTAGPMRTEKYCGPISLIIGLFFFPCICCCPCDERQVPA